MRDTLEGLEEDGELLEGLGLAPVERAVVVEDEDLAHPPAPEPERAFVSTPERLAHYLRMAEERRKREAEVEVPGVEGLPSFFQDNPWVAILARRAREAELVENYKRGRRFFRQDEGRGGDKRGGLQGRRPPHGHL